MSHNPGVGLCQTDWCHCPAIDSVANWITYSSGTGKACGSLFKLDALGKRQLLAVVNGAEKTGDYQV